MATAKSFALQALFQSLHRAVVQATRVAQEASLKALRRDYFQPVLDDDGKPTDTWEPKTLKMVLPHVDGEAITPVEYDVPLFSLVKHQAMVIDTLRMEFEVELNGLDSLAQADDEEGDGPVVAASTPAGTFSRKTIAKVEMTFKGDDPPEGTMRLNDKILTTFPS